MVAFRARPLNIEELAVQGIGSAAIGGIQEQMWRRGDQMGAIATIGAVGAGVALKMFGSGRLMDQLGDAAYMSGAAIGGWYLSQRILPATGTTSALRARAYNRPVAARPAVAPRQMPANRALPAGRPSYNRNGAAMPQVSLGGVNPNTGERMFFSRV